MPYIVDLNFNPRRYAIFNSNPRVWVTQMGVHANVDALADILNKSPDSIHEYVRNGMPQTKRGSYDIRECVSWLIENEKPVNLN